MKKMLFLIVMLLLPLATNAQLALKFGLTGNAALGDMSDSWDGGPGAHLGLEYMIAKHFNLGISSGFQHFFASNDLDEAVDDPGLNIVPIRLSFAYYIGERKFRPYFGAELGPTFVKWGWTIDDKDYEDDNTYFGAAPVIGLYINFGDSKVGADVNTKLNFFGGGDSDIDKPFYIGLNLGLVFRFW
ncbi:MAG: outer membrane beta-barrel protein [Bacteroidia bacterium]|nr:outer membrane beta-barrel protein [Bacteroidia bacterium]